MLRIDKQLNTESQAVSFCGGHRALVTKPWMTLYNRDLGMVIFAAGGMPDKE